MAGKCRPICGDPRIRRRGMPKSSTARRQTNKIIQCMIGSSKSRRRISLGAYPVMSLAEARKKASDLFADPRAAGGGRPRRGGANQIGDGR